MRKAICALFVALLASLLLFGCGQQEPADGSSNADYDSSEAVEETTDVVDESDLTEEDLIITRQDVSKTNEQGELIAELYYDLVQLPDTTEAYKKINAHLQEDYQAFLDEVEGPEIQQYIENAARSRADYTGDDWWNYYDTNDVSVTTCEDGVLSLCYGESWFMGGVANRNARGLSFDLKTGEPITLASIEKTLQEHADFLGYIKSHIFWTMTEESKIDSLTMDALQNLQLDDLAFYLEDKELTLYINTYQLASGAVGSFPVPTGLFVDKPQGEETSISGSKWFGLYPAEDGSIRLPYFDFSNDGRCVVWGAYYRSDAGVQLEGTYEVENVARDIVHFNNISDTSGTYSTSGEYELIRIGDSIQQMQLGDDILYKTSPIFTVWTLRTEVPM